MYKNVTLRPTDQVALPRDSMAMEEKIETMKGVHKYQHWPFEKPRRNFLPLN